MNKIFILASIIMVGLIGASGVTAESTGINDNTCPPLNCSNSTEYDINMEYLLVCGDRCIIASIFDAINHVYYILAGILSIIFFTLVGIIYVIKNHITKITKTLNENTQQTVAKSIEDKLADIASPLSRSPSSYVVPPAPIINI